MHSVPRAVIISLYLAQVLTKAPIQPPSPPGTPAAGFLRSGFMNTNFSQRADIEEGLAKGQAPSLEECRELLEDAAEGEELHEELDALKRALAGVGMEVIETTTDEDEQRTLEIISAQDPDAE